MCARGTFSAWMPVSVAEVVKAAFRSVRALAKRWLSAGECLVRLAEHFIETWREILKEVNTMHHRLRERDGHFCQVPGWQPPGGARTPHQVPLTRGVRRPFEPDQPLRRPPSIWHSWWPHARDRHCAGQTRLGIRPAAQLRSHRALSVAPIARRTAPTQTALVSERKSDTEAAFERLATALSK